MRPERREWGPSIDITDAELVADVFRGLQELVDGVSVSVTRYGSEMEDVSLTLSVLGWSRLSTWLESIDTVDTVIDALQAGGWICCDAERTEARELIEDMRRRRQTWSDFTDPDAPDLLELVADV